jgi:type I site-specific restriction endonuclease
MPHSCLGQGGQALVRLYRQAVRRMMRGQRRILLTMNFSPFADGTSDLRLVIQGHPPNLNRDLYFGIYQTLWSEDEQGRRLFQRFPRDFFDLVIIDECRRSGFGTWREVLDYFASAIHLGMTATPKQDESVDTYDYFCREELEVAVDPDDPTKGTWRPPAYQYSLGQGIEDGFLATYKVQSAHHGGQGWPARPGRAGAGSGDLRARGGRSARRLPHAPV